MRAFLAMELTEPVRSALADVIRQLSGATRSAKWVKMDQMHLTLKFFADLSEMDLAPLGASLGPALQSLAPPELRARGLGTFGPRGLIRVVWCGLEGDLDGLGRAASAAETAAASLGYSREERPFHPHLTLGRLREPSREAALASAVENLGAFDAGPFVPDHLVLFRSTLTPRGPVYERLAAWPLGGTECR